MTSRWNARHNEDVVKKLAKGRHVCRRTSTLVAPHSCEMSASATVGQTSSFLRADVAAMRRTPSASVSLRVWEVCRQQGSRESRATSLTLSSFSKFARSSLDQALPEAPLSDPGYSLHAEDG